MKKSGIDILKERDKVMFPNYDHSILSTISSILKYYKVDTPYKTLEALDKKLEKKYKNIIFIVLDGMGKNILDNIPNNYFSKNITDIVTSTYPCTTTAAMTTYYSGKPPIETGWIAWSQYIKEYGRYLDVLQKKDSYTKDQYNNTKKDLYDIIGYELIYDKIEKSSPDIKTFDVSPSYINQKSKRHMEAENIESMVENIKVLCSAEGEKFIFCYQDKPDGLLHKYGTESNEVKDYLNDAISKIKDMIDELDNSLIIITADHGHKDIKEEYDINEFDSLKDCFIMPPALESRCMTFWIKPKMLDIFKEEFNKNFGHLYVLLTKEEFLDNHFLGYGIEHKKIDDFIGDFIAISTGNGLISISNDFYLGKEKKLSTHCGLTKEEMEVPVIVIEKD